MNEFEKWALSKELIIEKFRNPKPGEFTYIDIETEMFWECWKAATEALNEEVQKITDWKDQAYPLDIFPEPDLKRVRELLEAGGVTIDVVSASNIRFALRRVCEMLNEVVR